jgi:hypothetical protein
MHFRRGAFCLSFLEYNHSASASSSQHKSCYRKLAHIDARKQCHMVNFEIQKEIKQITRMNKTDPDKTVQPIPAAVTPRAGARAAPSTTMPSFDA